MLAAIEDLLTGFHRRFVILFGCRIQRLADGLGGVCVGACLVVHLRQLGQAAPVPASADRHGSLQRRNRIGESPLRLKDKGKVEAALNRAGIDRDCPLQLLECAFGIAVQRE